MSDSDSSINASDDSDSHSFNSEGSADESSVASYGSDHSLDSDDIIGDDDSLEWEIDDESPEIRLGRTTYGHYFEKPNTTPIPDYPNCRKKLLSYLENIDDYHPFVQNEIKALAIKVFCAKPRTPILAVVDWLIEKLNTHIEYTEQSIKSRYTNHSFDFNKEKVSTMLTRTEKAIDMWEERIRPIIEEQKPLPIHVRNRSRELLEEVLDNGMNLLTVTDFLKEIVRVVQKKILGSYGFRYYQCRLYRRDDNVDNVTGEELENILRIVPMAIKGYPGVFARLSSTDLRFIPLLLRLRKEFFRVVFGGLYYDTRIRNEDELGGLMDVTRRGDRSLMQNLLLENDDQMLNVVRGLKNDGFLRKEHIHNENLIRYVIDQRVGLFAEKSFSFLVNWDPDELKRLDCRASESWLISQVRHRIAAIMSPYRLEAYKKELLKGMSGLPLHVAAKSLNLRTFQVVFEAGIRYFPKRQGINLLFHNYTQLSTRSPFQIACRVHGREEVLIAIERTLANCSSYNTEEAIVLAATSDEIHLDGVYFLLRREPDVLAKMLSLPSSSSSSSSIEGEGGKSTTAGLTKKRKRAAKR